ncbi:MAG: hypothetical protein ABFD91_12035 [Anaerohalosphaeraceae bacterium]
MGNVKCTILIVLCWDVFCCPVFGYNWIDNPGQGTPENPYQISTAEQLMAIGSDPSVLGSHFVLTADIDLSGRVFDEALIAPDIDWQRADYQGQPFTGSFDGRNKHIIGLVIEADQPGRDYLGLFGQLGSSAIVRDLDLRGLFINTPVSLYVGGLAGRAVSATVLRCEVEGQIFAAGLMGGLVGDAEQTTIKVCEFSGLMACDSSGYYLGGLVGRGYSVTIQGCRTLGRMILGEWSGLSGGLIGSISSSAILCSCAQMTMACGGHTAQIGGLVGVFSFSYVNNCYSQGSIDASSTADTFGGLIGQCDTVLFEIKNCYAVCQIIGGSGINVGGLIGFGDPQMVTQSYFLSTADGGGPDNNIGLVRTAVQLKQRATYEGWDFVGQSQDGSDEIWRMCKNGVAYPRLSWEYAHGGDFDCPDGIDTADLLALAFSWLGSEQADQTYRTSVDADCNGKIDLRDFAVLAGYWLSD